MGGLTAVLRKELADHFASKRFIILFLLIYLAGVLAIYVAAQNIRNEVSSSTRFIFLQMFISSSGSLPPFPFFMSFFVPIIGIAMGFDAMNSERNSGNMSRLLSQPLFRDALINGKFLAGLLTMVGGKSLIHEYGLHATTMAVESASSPRFFLSG